MCAMISQLQSAFPPVGQPTSGVASGRRRPAMMKILQARRKIYRFPGPLAARRLASDLPVLRRPFSKGRAMSELNVQQVATLDHLLVEREQSLKFAVQEHLARLQKIGDASETDAVGDLADQADIEHQRDEENVAVLRDVRELRAIESAHQRIANGQGGICIDCGEAIDFSRLLVQPTAVRCVVCQAAAEHVAMLRVRVDSGVAGLRR
jgi:RNA polymerase-binding transcription factor DksA